LKFVCENKLELPLVQIANVVAKTVRKACLYNSQGLSWQRVPQKLKWAVGYSVLKELRKKYINGKKDETKGQGIKITIFVYHLSLYSSIPTLERESR